MANSAGRCAVNLRFCGLTFYRNLWLFVITAVAISMILYVHSDHVHLSSHVQKVEDLETNWESFDQFSSRINTFKKWRFCVCAVIQNELAYLPEWIEFHRLQGVDHFALYDYNNTDLVQYLPMWYADNGHRNLINVLPSRFVPEGERLVHDTESESHRFYAMFDCYMRHRKDAEMIIMLQTNQFLYSPKSGLNLWTAVHHIMKDNASAISVHVVTYGRPDSLAEFDNWMSPNSYTGSADFLYKPLNQASDEFPLVIETNRKREPLVQLQKNLIVKPPCDTQENVAVLCERDNAVIILKSTRCNSKNISLCIFSNAPESALEKQNALFAKMEDLRVNFYPWRPLNSIHKNHVGEYLHRAVSASAWFSQVEDGFGEEYGSQVRKAILKLRPRMFIDVGRKCAKTALRTGQQIRCPANHPYPFSQRGVYFLRACCKTDRDRVGRRLTVESTDCQGDQFVECSEPTGVEKWVHRSCCINQL